MSTHSRAMDRALAATVVALSLHAGTAHGQTEDAQPVDAAQALPEAAPVAATDTPAPAAEAAAPISETVPVQVAEEATASPERAKSGSRFIEEIVVTAQKREENLQDVPISVQAFSAEALDARGIEEPKALAISTPGMSYTVFAGYSLIYIRGVGTDAFIPSADASVATYIDNIYYPFGHSLASALGNVARVEVLKGPQGTLFGRNSTGGAINIVTKQPGPDFENQVTLSAEEYDKLNLRAYTNIPLTDTLAISVSGIHYEEDNYNKAASTSGRTLPKETSRAFSVKAGWQPTDDLSAVIGYSYINTQGSNAMSLPVTDPKVLGVALGVSAQPDYVTGEDAPTYVDTDSRILTGDIKYTLPWFDTRLIVGDQRIKSPALADYDGSDQPLVTFEVPGQFSDTTTAEFQILSNQDSWNAEKLQYIVGLYFIDSSAGYDPLNFTLAPGLANGLINGGILSGPLGTLVTPAVNALFNTTAALFDALTLDNPSTAGVVDPVTTLTNIANNGVNLNVQGVLDTRSTAAFFQTTYNFTEQWALTLGGRYQEEKRTLAKSTVRFQPNANDDSVLIPLFDFNTPLYGYDGPRKAKTQNFSPKVVVNYKPGDDQLLYASYSKGFKSGTFNIIGLYAPTQYVEPEEVNSYELGYKSTWLDGALRLNGAVFQNTIDNLQVQTISLTSGGAVRFETAGSARIRGAEFDILWQVAPDTLPGLVLTSTGSYLKGVYTDYENGSGFNQTTGVFTTGQDFTGNDLVRTPKFSGTFGPSYTFDFANSSLEFAADAYYNSGSYFSAQNTETAHQDAYTVLNARISYHYQPWDVRVTLLGRNITDEKYAIVLQELDFGTARLLAAPAIYGVKVQWNF